MASFYAQWIAKNKRENEQLLKQLQGGSDSAPTSNLNTNTSHQNIVTKPTDITYQNEKFQLIIEEKHHSRQKMFKIQDALFIVKVIPLTDERSPLLIDLLTFLQSGFEQLLMRLKNFFQSSEHRIAYLTIYQQPMELIAFVEHFRSG